MFEIRILDARDTNDYQALRLESFKESPYAFSESYEDEVKRSLEDFKAEIKAEGTPPEQFVLGVIKEKNSLIGFVKFRRDKRTKARHKSMIHAMYISSQYRNLQLGEQLIQELIKRAKALEGLEQIHLWVLHSSTSASNFYKRCGFVSQGTYVKQDLKIGNDYVDAEYMVMYL